MIYIIHQTPRKRMTFQPIRFELQQQNTPMVPAAGQARLYVAAACAAEAHFKLSSERPAAGYLSTESVNN